MTATETPFRFNDELLLSARDRDFAAKRYKQVYFALDHPELRAVFERLDRQARAAKAKSRRLGLAALGLAAASLLAFPLEPVVRTLSGADGESLLVLRALAMVGAVCGILAILLGNLGVGFGANKRAWLQKRLACERIRQWRAQYLLATAADIAHAAGDAGKQSAYLEARDMAFEKFERAFLDQIASEYAKHTQSNAAAKVSGRAVSDDDLSSFWIEPAWAEAAGRAAEAPAAPALRTLGEAYEALRLGGQIQYTNYVLSDQGGFWSHPARQLFILGNVTFSLVVMAFLSNLVALVLAAAGASAGDGAILGSVAMALAILAVASRALQEGLHPRLELNRMEHYARAVDDARRRIQKADHPGEALIAAQRLERAATEEMLDFLSVNDRARFVL